MTIGQSMLPEFDEEMKNTRKVLERVPDEKWNWKPHEKSGTLGWLAAHVGTVPGWITMTINTESWIMRRWMVRRTSRRRSRIARNFLRHSTKTARKRAPRSPA